MKNVKKESLPEEEKQRLISFIEILIQIDRREKVTKTSQQWNKKNKTTDS